MKLQPQAEHQPRAVLYLRQSVATEESISLELQESAGREYCARQGYRIVAVEQDPGISGRTWKRPAVQRVMDMVASRDVDVVVLWKWSRLSRSRLDWAVAIDKVESVGGRIESATEQVDTTTSTGRLARGMLAEFAAFESERIGDVWKETHQRRVNAGLPASGRPRFGYVLTEGRYEVNPELAPIIAEIYDRYTNREEGWLRITKWLNRSGIRNAVGSEWSAMPLRRFARSGFAAGLLITNTASSTPPVYHPGAQEPIISEELWQRFKARSDGAQRPPRSIEPTSPITGLAFCDDCGGPMAGGSRSGKRGLACGRQNRTGKGRATSCYREDVENLARAWVAELAEDLEVQAAQRAATETAMVTRIDNTATLEKKLASLRERLGALTVRYADNRLTDDAYDAAVAKTQSDIDDIRERLASAPIAQPPVDVRALSYSITKNWDDFTVLELRTMLSKLIHQIRVIPPPLGMPGRPRVTYRIIPKWEA